MKNKTMTGIELIAQERQDGTDEWTAGSSDDVTDNVECWFRKEK